MIAEGWEREALPVHWGFLQLVVHFSSTCKHEVLRIWLILLLCCWTGQLAITDFTALLLDRATCDSWGVGERSLTGPLGISTTCCSFFFNMQTWGIAYLIDFTALLLDRATYDSWRVGERSLTGPLHEEKCFSKWGWYWKPPFPHRILTSSVLERFLGHYFEKSGGVISPMNTLNIIYLKMGEITPLSLLWWFWVGAYSVAPPLLRHTPKTC